MRTGKFLGRYERATLNKERGELNILCIGKLFSNN